MAITFSEALPIHIWANDEESFNEEEECMIEKFCFNQEFECGDVIRLQFIDDEDSDEDYDLVFYDEDDNEIYQSPFTKVKAQLFDPLQDWNQGGGGEVWTGIGTPNPSVTLPAGSTFSNLFLTSIVPPASTLLRVVYDFDNSAVASDLIFRFRFSGSAVTPLPSTVPLGVGNTSGYFDITLDSIADDFTVEIQKPSGAETTISPNFIKLYKASNVNDIVIYSISLIPNDIDLCDQSIYFKVLKNSDDSQIGRSDIVRFSNEIACNTLLKYKRSQSRDGIFYDETSEFFEIRIPGVFYHKAPVTTQASMELSNSKVITRSWTKKKRTRWKIQDMPYYMHDKLELILAHCVGGTLEINGVQWSLATGDVYAIGEERPDSYPMRDAEVLLTRKNYFKQAAL